MGVQYMVSSIHLRTRRTIESVCGKFRFVLATCIISSFFNTISLVSSVSAQVVLFDFDNAPLYSSLPTDQTAGGITAHISATGQGFSIQNADVLGFTPQGFAGHILYPNGIDRADLLIRFDKLLIDFSIMYTPHELGCDNSATMRVTAYANGTFVGTTTKTASFPGTWPVDTLRCGFPQGFDSVVVHYDSPPTCQDYGTVYMADNMRVTGYAVNVAPEGARPDIVTLQQNYPNPFNPTTTMGYTVGGTRHQASDVSHVRLSVFDILGREVVLLVNEEKAPGRYEVEFNASALASGVYFYRLSSGMQVESRKMVLMK